MILPEDKHDTVRETVRVDLNTVRSHEESPVSTGFLSPDIPQPHLTVPVLLHHMSKYLFNIFPHLVKQYLPG